MGCFSIARMSVGEKESIKQIATWGYFSLDGFEVLNNLDFIDSHSLKRLFSSAAY